MKKVILVDKFSSAFIAQTTRSGKALSLLRCGLKATLLSWIKERGGGTANNNVAVSFPPF